jgi:predicted enzyme related to lactoylglutathione lyase
MKVKEIAFVVYPVTNLAAARKFYEDVLGLEQSRMFGSEEQGMIEYDLGASTLAIGNAATIFSPGATGGCAALEVESFEDAVADIEASGCPIVMPVYETPVCRMMAVSDPDGNTVMIHCAKPE